MFGAAATWFDASRAWFQALPIWGILLVTLGAAVLLQWVVVKAIGLFARRTKTSLDEQILRTLRWPLFVSMILIGVYVALKRIDPPLTAKALGIWRSAFWTITIIVWMRATNRVCDAVLDALARRADDFKWIEARTLPLFEILARLFVVGGAIYLVLTAWTIDVTAWLASAGILGIAIGFAAKDTLANLFSGIFILADAPYKIGDFINLDSGERGRVTDIGIRSTRLLTRDDIEITVPNAVIANAKIVNESGGPHEKARVRLTIGVAYGSDVDQVRAVLEQEAAACPHIAKDPAPRVRFREFGDSALTFQLLGWIDEPVLRGRALDDLNTRVYKRFLREGIEIPFPQRVVTLKQE